MIIVREVCYVERQRKWEDGRCGRTREVRKKRIVCVALEGSERRLQEGGTWGRLLKGRVEKINKNKNKNKIIKRRVG